jgi:hypothetical protein
MSATLTAGLSSIILKVDTPMDTDGITPRDDLIGIKVWYSTSPILSTVGVTPYYDGTGLTLTIPGLTGGVPYYVKYALISEIEPDNYTVSTQLTATPGVVVEAFSPPTFYISNYGSTFRKDIDGTIYPSSGIIIETGYSNFKSSPQPTFQWKKDNVNISGATSFSYTVPASDYADGSTTHTYSCAVSGLDLSGAAKSITSSTTIPLISDGVRGPRTANGYLYYQTAVATDPGTPTATNYNFTTGQFATLTAGWGYTPISASTTNTSLKGWVCRFVVIEPSYGVATGNATVSANSTSITFDGIVTFSNYASGSTPLATAASVASKLDTTTANSSTYANSLIANTTVIDGGKITTGTIAASRLDLSGVLTATNLGTGGTTQIDGARITTGTINAARLNLSGYLQVGNAASDINSNTTKISGGQIVTGSISADRLSIGQTTSNNRIRLYDNKIEVWADNGSGQAVRRVVIGYLL